MFTQNKFYNTNFQMQYTPDQSKPGVKYAKLKTPQGILQDVLIYEDQPRIPLGQRMNQNKQYMPGQVMYEQRTNFQSDDLENIPPSFDRNHLLNSCLTARNKYE